MKHLAVSAVLFLVLVVCLFGTTSGSRVIYPPGPYPEFNTPVMTNGFVGAPSDFSVTANFTVQYPGCTSYAAPGMLVISMTGWCHISDKFELARQGGAVGFIFSGFEVLGVGRISRVPVSKTPLDIPAVIISYPDFLMLSDIAEKTGSYVTIEITPGVSEWHTNVGNTGWFKALNVIFGAFYLALLALVIYKLIRKVRATGFILNISFVYLFFQFVFCIMMIVRWIDPVLTWGIISHDADAFMDQWPATWSFAALVLMAFFWFEVINQFADTKVQPFLSKKLQIPFWILVAIIILLPAINSIIIGYASITELLIALLYIPFFAGMIVAAFYIVVAVKALQVIKRSERLNVDKKTRVNGLMRSRISIIISTIIACIYPPCNFFLRYFIVSGNLYLALAALFEESVFLGIITFIQVWFMPDKSPGMSSTASRTSTNLNSQKPTKDDTTASINSTAEV